MEYCDLHKDPSDWEAEDGFDCPYCWALWKKAEILAVWGIPGKKYQELQTLRAALREAVDTYDSTGISLELAKVMDKLRALLGDKGGD